MFISFPRFGKSSASISSNKFSAPFFLSSSYGTTIMHLFVHLMVFGKSLSFSSLFCILFCCCSSEWIILNDLSLNSLVLSFDLSNLILNIANEFFSLMYSSAQKCLFDSFLYIVHHFVDILLLFVHHFPELIEHLYDDYCELLLK